VIGFLPQISHSRAMGVSSHERTGAPLPRRSRNRPILARYDRAVQSDRPVLVIVSGAPASGKTTLARRLADDLQLPLVAKDALKEALADALGPPVDVAASVRLGTAAYAILYLQATELLQAERGVIVESNFRRGLSEIELQPLLGRWVACLVHCRARDDVLLARYAERFARGERHPAHLDAERDAALRADLAAGTFEPLELAIPSVVVDTTDEICPSYEVIRDFVAMMRVSAE
jgi:predicted kinase